MDGEEIGLIGSVQPEDIVECTEYMLHQRQSSAKALEFQILF